VNPYPVSAARNVAAGALVVAAAGIGIQILAGADYPVVPPGAIILLAAAAVCTWWRRWWTPLIATAVSVFLLAGAVLAPNTGDNLGAGLGSGRVWGTVLQLLAVLVALAASLFAVRQERRLSAAA
jgi:hypothetical protein